MDAYETHLHQHAVDEEESQLRDNEAPTGHMDTEEDGSVGMDGCDVNSSAQKRPPELTQGVRDTKVLEDGSRSVYTCGVCGKIYTYLVSFQKHQKIHESSPEREKPRSLNDPNLRNYECPDCGMSFIRRTRLINHLRVHRSKRSNNLPKCDQCNKVYTSLKSWKNHVELHKERRFWCLSCAQGFMNEGMLDKHLQSHSLRQQNYNADDQSLHNAKPLQSPPKTQRTYQCLHCGKRFWRSKALFKHKLKHPRCQRRVTCKLPGIYAFNQVVEDMKRETSLRNGREKLEMDASMEKLQVKEENMQIDGQSPDSAAEDGDPEDFEDSDCGEPGHGCEISAELRSSEAAQTPAGKESEKAEPKLHKEHTYLEWECIECDMGFDEMAKLHSHYVKHATGELPIPKEEIEG